MRLGLLQSSAECYRRAKDDFATSATEDHIKLLKCQVLPFVFLFVVQAMCNQLNNFELNVDLILANANSKTSHALMIFWKLYHLIKNIKDLDEH